MQRWLWPPQTATTHQRAGPSQPAPPTEDRRFKMDSEVVNFFDHYEINDDTSKHVLALEACGGLRRRLVTS